MRVSGLPDGTVAIAPDGGGGTMVTGTPTSYVVHNEAELGDALGKIDVGGLFSAVDTPYTITFAAGLPSGSLVLTHDLPAINLMTGSSVTFIGNGQTLSGGGAARGLFLQSGQLTLNGLTIANPFLVAQVENSWSALNHHYDWV